uniref:Uncharacterized protein n=1 Tax=Anopheles melas TaxID=34690 RepID=A0A182TXN3_9DIPT
MLGKAQRVELWLLFPTIHQPAQHSSYLSLVDGFDVFPRLVLCQLSYPLLSAPKDYGTGGKPVKAESRTLMEGKWAFAWSAALEANEATLRRHTEAPRLCDTLRQPGQGFLLDRFPVGRVHARRIDLALEGFHRLAELFQPFLGEGTVLRERSKVDR